MASPALNTGYVTVDDFDPLVSYSNYADWSTPDPSLNPTWYNETEEVTGSPYHQGKRPHPSNGHVYIVS